MNKLPIEDDLWRISLADYAARLSRYRAPWTPFPWLRLVSLIVSEAIFKGGGRLIINAPPRHGKSMLLSKWLPLWFLDMWPEKRVILTSYGDALARDWGRAVRDEFMQNPEVLTRVHPGSHSVTDWMTTKGGGMRTAGVGGPITGKGADLCVVDDAQKNWQDAMSIEKRRGLVEWFNSTLYTRLEPGATLVVVQTRWHEKDLTGYLEKEHGDRWTKICFPALAEGADVLGRSEGEALCPERFSREALLGIKNGVGSQVFTGLYQQRPSPVEGSIIKRDWFRFYETLPDKLDRWWQSWDLTFDETGHGSYVVGQVWAQKGANCYLVHQHRAREEFTASLRAVASTSAAYPQATEKRVEKKANGAALLSVLRDKIPGLVAKEPHGDKEARLRAVSPLFEAGNVWVPTQESAPWVGEYVEELVSFPRAENDDQVDATSMALVGLQDARVLDIAAGLAQGSQASYWNSLGNDSDAPHLSGADILLR